MCEERRKNQSSGSDPAEFEIGGIAGDFPGEAQLFYECYCAGCEEIDIANITPSAQFYMNEENGVGLLK